MNKLFMKLKGKLVDVIIISDDKNNEWKTNIRLQKKKKENIKILPIYKI